MRKLRPGLVVAAYGVMGLAVWVSGQMRGSADTMAAAAQRLLAALDEGQRGKAAFAFDDPERLNWHFIPRERKGLALKTMTPEQQALAFGLLQSGLSQQGNLKATTIMSLEAILRDLEKGSGPVRDPELYFFSVFGQPSNQGRWGWRVEGHHLSLNFTVDGGKVVSATPAFFGANPGRVVAGPREGLAALADFEEGGLRLVQSLDDAQKKLAIVAEKAPADIESNTGIGQKGPGGGLATRAPSDAREGIPVEKLSANQKAMLRSLIEAYAADMPQDVATGWLAEVDRAGNDLAFAWYGGTDRKEPHAYQIQAPGFQVEFNNTQNNANHIHSVYRTTLDDFDTAP